jgi:hypothetical protein
METLTSPPLFLEMMGNLALDIRLFVMKLMPLIVVLVFIWGYLTFLFGMSNAKLDLKKYMFTPLFLLLLVSYYPLFIDITGGLYGTVIRAFDRSESKDFIIEYMGVQKELESYEATARYQLSHTPEAYKKQKNELLRDQQEAIDDPALYAAYEQAIQEINRNLAKVGQLKSNVATGFLKDIWDFFKLPVVRIVRCIIDLVRNVFVSLLVIFGCFAIFFESIPIFKGILGKWFKFYTATTFWALTVSILDSIFLAFSKAGVASGKYFFENAQKIAAVNINANALMSGSTYGGTQSPTPIMKDITDFGIMWYSYGGSEGLNLAVSVVLVLCYCLVPYITSLYIGGENAGMFMSKVVGTGSMAVKQTMSTATSGVGTAVGATSSNRASGEMAKMGANVASVAAAFGSGNK